MEYHGDMFEKALKIDTSRKESVLPKKKMLNSNIIVSNSTY